MSIEIITEDNVEMTLNRKIGEMSKLFETLLENYSFSGSKEKLASIQSKDLKLLIEFCEMCNYSNFSLNKPLWVHDVNYHLEGLKEKVKNFYYEKLTNDEIIIYSKIADYFSVPALEELIVLKLFEVFSSQEKIINFFKNEYNFTDKDFILDENRKQFLKEKYDFYINKQIEKMDEDEINNLCHKFFK